MKVKVVNIDEVYECALYRKLDEDLHNNICRQFIDNILVCYASGWGIGNLEDIKTGRLYHPKYNYEAFVGEVYVDREFKLTPYRVTVPETKTNTTRRKILKEYKKVKKMEV